MSQKIIICRATRRNMQLSFIWPSFLEEINPGKLFSFKIVLFLLTYSLVPISVLIHLIVTLHDDLPLPISEDIAVITSMFGISYMAIIYVRKQPKIARLLLDLSNFERFGQPADFEKVNKKMNFWSWCASLYPTFGSFSYMMIKLMQKSECENLNIQKNLNEKCGLVYPFWIPFEINYFPVFHLICFLVWLSTALLVRLHLSISFHALEIASHIILRIKHLNTMILEAFNDEDFFKNRRNILKCILYYAEILDMSERLDDCFSNVMFVHFAMTATVCGCLEKQFFDGDYPVTAAVHLLGWINSLFIASLGGQNLVDASETIPDAIWSSKWYTTDLRLRKFVLLMLIRSQKDLHLSVGSFGILSYTFFASVMKMSYSILAMLTSENN